MQLLFSFRRPLPFWLGLAGLVLAGLPGVAQTVPPVGPGFPGGPGPINLPNIPVRGPGGFPFYPSPGWDPTTYGAPYPGWNQTWTGYDPRNAPPLRNFPCPGDILMNPQSIAPSKPGNYNGGTFGNTRVHADGTPKFHDGLDIMATPGTPLGAAYDGVVTRVERNFSPGEYAYKSYGNFVEVRSVVNGQTITLKYNHLDAVSTQVQENVTVRAGATIGLSGTTGNAAPNPDTPNAPAPIPHVHIQARDANGGRANPEDHLGTKFDHKTGKLSYRPC